MITLPDETEADLLAQAAVSDGDIASAQAWTRTMKASARYFDGDELQAPLSATVAKKMLEATEAID